MAWRRLLLALLLRLACGQATPPTSLPTEPPQSPGCSALAQTGRRVDLSAPGLTLLANRSLESAEDSCPGLCCERPGCGLAVLDGLGTAEEGPFCLLLTCGGGGCDTLPARRRRRRQKLWLIVREEAESPATAALLSRSDVGMIILCCSQNYS